MIWPSTQFSGSATLCVVTRDAGELQRQSDALTQWTADSNQVEKTYAVLFRVILAALRAQCLDPVLVRTARTQLASYRRTWAVEVLDKLISPAAQFDVTTFVF